MSTDPIPPPQRNSQANETCLPKRRGREGEKAEEEEREGAIELGEEEEMIAQQLGTAHPAASALRYFPTAKLILPAPPQPLRRPESLSIKGGDGGRCTKVSSISPRHPLAQSHRHNCSSTVATKAPRTPPAILSSWVTREWAAPRSTWEICSPTMVCSSAPTPGRLLCSLSFHCRLPSSPVND